MPTRPGPRGRPAGRRYSAKMNIALAPATMRALEVEAQHHDRPPAEMARVILDVYLRRPNARALFEALVDKDPAKDDGSGTRPKPERPHASPLDLLHKIRHELAYTALQWHVFEATFTDANRDLLQRSAPGFLEVVNVALQRDVFLALARLMDPARSFGHENVSLRALVEALAASSVAPRLSQHLDAFLADLATAAERIWKYRDKYLAHSDLAYALGHETLEASTRADVHAIIDGASEIVLRVGEVLVPDAVSDPRSTSHLGGVRRLLELLRLALSHDDSSPGREDYLP